MPLPLHFGMACRLQARVKDQAENLVPAGMICLQQMLLLAREERAIWHAQTLYPKTAAASTKMQASPVACSTLGQLTKRER